MTVNSYVLVEALSEVCTADHIIVTDVGFAFQCVNQAWLIKQGQRLLSNCGLASMGWGLPAAIGAAFGCGRPVVCIAGDGGMMMNLQELATLAHHKLDVKLFVLNNGGYLTQRHAQQYAFGREIGSGSESLSFPKFQWLASAFGISYVKLDSHKNMKSTLQSVTEWDGPVFIEVMMDKNQDQAPRALNRRLPDGTMKQTAIEDAYPFLDPKEVQENIAMGLAV